MTDGAKRRGPILSVATAAFLALAAGSPAQAECAAEIAALERQLMTGEARERPAADERQQAIAERQRQAMAEPHQPQPPGEMQSVRPPAGATMGQPAPSGPIGAQQPGAGAPQPDREAAASQPQTALAGQPDTRHPLVLQMADGSIVDLRPPEEREAAAPEARQTAEPERAPADRDPAQQQAAAGVPDESQGAEALLTEARLALQRGDEAACLEAVAQARAELVR